MWICISNFHSQGKMTKKTGPKNSFLQFKTKKGTSNDKRSQDKDNHRNRK